MARLEVSGLKIEGDDLDSPPTVTVVLSKRNVLALLHKVDQEWSAKTLTNDYVWFDDELLPVDTLDFNIMVEPDEQHYAARSQPGSMHKESENFIAAHHPTPCFCGTPDAHRCPAHINPVQLTTGGR